VLLGFGGEPGVRMVIPVGPRYSYRVGGAVGGVGVGGARGRGDKRVAAFWGENSLRRVSRQGPCSLHVHGRVCVAARHVCSDGSWCHGEASVAPAVSCWAAACH
jgi:hypothetical protein